VTTATNTVTTAANTVTRAAVLKAKQDGQTVTVTLNNNL
jgi:uncharacterized protein GlcG (DUF336 family)